MNGLAAVDTIENGVEGNHNTSERYLHMVDKQYQYSTDMFKSFGKHRREKGSTLSSENEDTPNKKKQRHTSLDADAKGLKDITEEVVKNGEDFDLITEIRGLRAGQVRLEKLLDSKMLEIKEELRGDMDKKIEKVSASVKSKVNSVQGQIHSIEQQLATFDLLKDQVTALETQAKAGYIQAAPGESVDNIELTVVCSGVTQRQDEEALAVAKDIIKAIRMDGNVTVTGARRLKVTGAQQNGLLKISFSSLQEKIAVLKAKSRLKETRKYMGVYIRRSMDHMERVVQQNAKTILNLMPDGHKYRIAGSGKIVQKARDGNSVDEKKDQGAAGYKQLPSDASTGGHVGGARPRVYDNKDGTPHGHIPPPTLVQQANQPMPQAPPPPPPTTNGVPVVWPADDPNRQKDGSGEASQL